MEGSGATLERHRQRPFDPTWEAAEESTESRESRPDVVDRCGHKLVRDRSGPDRPAQPTEASPFIEPSDLGPSDDDHSSRAVILYPTQSRIHQQAGDRPATMRGVDREDPHLE